LKLTIRDTASGEPTFCRVNVVGSDGNYYYPKQNYLSRFALTGQWTGRPPNMALGNRVGQGADPLSRRFFYSWGQNEVEVPPGSVRVEVWKGLEYRPQIVTTQIGKNEARAVEVTLTRDPSIAQSGYYAGDSHLHFPRQSDVDDQTIFDLLETEDIHFASILAYNEPAGPYAGFMQSLAAPQFRGLGTHSLKDRGQLSHPFRPGVPQFHVRAPQSLFPRRLGLQNQKVNANNAPCMVSWPVRRATREDSPFYCHGGYAQTIPYAEIYADAIQGNVDGVELLQFRHLPRDGAGRLYRF